ncbi:uncharacterized protein [Ptychodera flava]|uniref:uncharacterized protein n=1 Tax=Ptychodera flava TaxID=63121 RepID=UPI00396A11F0
MNLIHCVLPLSIFLLITDVHAANCPLDGREIQLKESVILNTTVCSLKEGLTKDSDLYIVEETNVNDRFKVERINDTWMVRVKHLLDDEIGPRRYGLIIKSGKREATDEKVGTVKIVVQNDPHWPPKFNYNCSTVFRNYTKPPWAFDAKGDVDAPFLGGTYVLSDDTSASSVSINIDNDKCHVKAYGRVKYENNTIIDVDKLVHEFDPDRDVECHPTSKYDRNRLPKITAYKNPKVDRPTDPYIPKKWFEEENPNVRVVLLEIVFDSVYTERISSWACRVQTHIIGYANATLDLIPTGCPSGFYGGNCKKKCVCQNNATCHPFNGACECAPGFKAPDCTISYAAVGVSPRRPSVHYGDPIELTCKAYHVDEHVDFDWSFNAAPLATGPRHRVESRSDGSRLIISPAKDEDRGQYTCHGKTSSLPTLSTDVTLTFEGCHDNHWGPKCDEKCDCENDANCDRLHGCMCKATHWWGDKCDRHCYCKQNGTCDREEGFCSCPQWSYGKLCQYVCECAEGANSCEVSNGRCNCMLGWSGDKCDFDLRRPAFIVGVTVSGMVVLIVAVVVGIKWYRRRRYTQIRESSKKLLFSKNDDDEDDDEEGALYDRRL